MSLAFEILVGPNGSVVDTSDLVDFDSSADDVAVGDGAVFLVGAVGQRDPADQLGVALEWRLNVNLALLPFVDPHVVLGKAAHGLLSVGDFPVPGGAALGGVCGDGVESLLALERAALVRAVDDVHRRRVVVVELGAVGHLGRFGSLGGLWRFGTSDFAGFSVHTGVFPDAELGVALGSVDGDFGAVLAGKFASITITPRFYCVRSGGEFVKITQLVINVTGDVVVGALPDSSFAFH